MKRTNYKSQVDPAKIIWSSRTHRSASEAFKDADYATPIWRCETDTQKGLKFLVEMVVGMLMVALPLSLVYSFVVWLDSVK
jgi:hypothetical protein